MPSSIVGDGNGGAVVVWWDSRKQALSAVVMAETQMQLMSISMRNILILMEMPYGKQWKSNM